MVAGEATDSSMRRIPGKHVREEPEFQTQVSEPGVAPDRLTREFGISEFQTQISEQGVKPHRLIREFRKATRAAY